MIKSHDLHIFKVSYKVSWLLRATGHVYFISYFVSQLLHLSPLLSRGTFLLYPSHENLFFTKVSLRTYLLR